MISIELMGGLGNQMFQIAATLSKAFETDEIACFNLDKDVYRGQGHHPSFYKTNIFSKLCNSNTSKCTKLHQEYYQSEKYFNNYKDEIVNIFRNEEVLNRIRSKYPLESSVSVHVRRGDYLSLQHYHPCPPLEYYKNAISQLSVENVLIFSDDINWCKNNFNNCMFIEGQEDYEDMYLMSLCTHHIIANSSFSWWGAYLSKNDGTVFAPKKWFGEGGPQNWKDVYCKNWIVC